MKLRWIGIACTLALAACGPAGSSPTPDAGATALMEQIVATATALRLTAQAANGTAVRLSETQSVSPATPAPVEAIQLSVSPAQSLGGTDFQISGPVTIAASAPNIIRVEFYTQPSGPSAQPALEFTDAEGGDGWSWTWPSPPPGWFGQVWVIAYYADESSTSSELFITVAP